MSCVTLRMCLLSAIALGVCVSLSAQSDESTQPAHVKVIPAPASRGRGGGRACQNTAASAFLSDPHF